MLHGVFKLLLNGLQERGEGGFVYVNGEEAAYCFPDDMPNKQFADGMKKMIQHTKDVFFVAEERDSKVHVLTYPRAVVFAEVKEELDRMKLNVNAPVSTSSTEVRANPDDHDESKIEEITDEPNEIAPVV